MGKPAEASARSHSIKETETVVQDCIGYRLGPWSHLSYVLLVLLSGGTFWVFVQLCPVLAIRLLASCPLQQADYVLVKLIDDRQIVAQVDTQKHVVLPEMSGAGEMGHRDRSQQVRIIHLFLRDYFYSPSEGKFVPVPAMPEHLQSEICRALHALRCVDQGADWKGFNELHRMMRHRSVSMYGNKSQLYRGMDLLRSASQDAALPLFAIQYVECVYLACTGSWVFPIILLIISLAANLGRLAELHQQHVTITGLINQRCIVGVVLEGWVRALPSYRLVPGDVIVVQRGKATCDMVLLRGNCLVEESMLSGEAVQVRKASYVADQGVKYDPDSYHFCTVYAGTVVQQVWNAEDTEDEVLAMVVRTGLNTCMGNMIRQLLAPSWQYVEKDPVITLVILVPYLVKAAHYKQSAGSIALRVLDSLVHAAPPGVTTVMLFCGGAGKVRLSKRGINLVFPEALKLGADTDTVCFDKTGTLTDSLAEFHGVVPAFNGHFQALQQSSMRWSNRLKQAVAVCNGLTMITKSLVVGDDMERSLFKRVEAQFVDRQTIAMPRRSDQISELRTVKLKMLKVFEFNSQTLKSGVVVLSDDTPSGTGLLFVKGAHTAIKSLVLPASLPPDFDEVVDEYSRKSFRVTALAVGSVKLVDRLDLSRMSLQQVEACATGLSLLGLMVITNELRSGSRDTVVQLQQGGGLRTMMITGDYHHTAIAVAKAVGMLQPDSPVMIIDTVKAAPETMETDRQGELAGSAAALQLQPELIAGNATQTQEACQAADQERCQLQSRSSSLLQSQAPIQSLLHQSPNTGLKHSHSQAQSQSQAQPHALSQAPVLAQSQAHIPAQTLSQMSQAGSSILSRPQHAQHVGIPTALLPMPQAVQSSQTIQSPPLPSALSSDHPSIVACPVEVQSMGQTLKHVHFVTSLADSESLDSDLSGSAQPSGTTCQYPQPTPTRLRFVMGGVGVEWGCSQAVTAMAEGRLQCAVTGDAVQLLLQLADESVLGAVIQNAVVFARMKPHHKGQVVSLLNTRGIYQMHEGKRRHIQGLQQTVLFCGDGINDLSALSAADVGYAVGSTEASIAAAVTSRGSVTGVCEFIKEGKVTHAQIAAMFKYMVSYQFIGAVALSITFYLDGSSFSRLQQGAIDFIAMTMAFVTAAQVPKRELQRIRPDQRVSTVPKYIILMVSAICCFIAQLAVAVLLCTRPWYTGGTGSADQNPVNSALWLTAMNQLLAIPISLLLDVWPFSESPLHSKPFMMVTSLYYTLIFLIILVGPAHRANIFHLYLFPEAFRLQQMGVLMAAGCSYAVMMHIVKHMLVVYQHRKVAVMTS